MAKHCDRTQKQCSWICQILCKFNQSIQIHENSLSNRKGHLLLRLFTACLQKIYILPKQLHFTVCPSARMCGTKPYLDLSQLDSCF